jgi:hypothetical protein
MHLKNGTQFCYMTMINSQDFQVSLEEWLSALLPNNALLTQKEWMMNTMKKPYIMKVKDFGNRLKTFNHFLTLLPHDDKKDDAFTIADLKALIFKSIPLSWQNAYLLKGTHISDEFQQMPSYFVQLQSITDNQTDIKAFSASQNLDN